MIQYSEVETPRWANSEKTEILVLVNWDVIGQKDWARLIPQDNSPHIKALLSEILAGEHGPIGEYIAPTQEQLDAEAADRVRVTRDAILLGEVDPIVSNPLRWGSLSDEQQLAFTVYRQNLLDIPEQEGFPHNVVWPTKPEV